MRALGLSGAAPGRKPRATGPAEGDRAPGDLLRRDFTATGPNRRWVVDFTHVPTWSGFCYTAFVMDLFSRRIVGWATSSRMDTDNAGSALEQAIWQRKHRDGGDLEGLVHHSDHGSKSPVHRLQRTTRPRGDPGPPPEPWAPPTTTPPPRPWASPTSASSSGATAPGRDAPTPATATARWVDWYNRTRPHLTNDDDLPHTTVEHRYNHNHTTTPPTTV